MSSFSDGDHFVKRYSLRINNIRSFSKVVLAAMLACIHTQAYAWKLGEPPSKLVKDTGRDLDKGPIGDLGRGVEHLGKEIIGVNSGNRTEEARRERESANVRNGLLLQKSNLDAQLAKLDAEVQSINTSIAEKTTQKNQLVNNANQFNAFIKSTSTIERYRSIFISLEKVKQQSQEYGNKNSETLEGKSPMELWKEVVESYGQQQVESDFPKKDELVSTLTTLYRQLEQLVISDTKLNIDINSVLGSPDFEEMEKRLLGLDSSLTEIQTVQNGQISDLSASIAAEEEDLKGKIELKETIQAQLSEVEKSLGIQ